MKLIGTDGVKKDLLAELLTGVDGGTDASYLKTYEVINRIENIVNEWVDNQPTVEAIPIEWIEKFIDNDILSETVKILLNAWYWEKENEQNKDNTSQTD